MPPRHRPDGRPHAAGVGVAELDYSAQSAGPPPWHLHRFTIDTAFGVGLREPHGASRWRF
jgi:hypothetical protein